MNLKEAREKLSGKLIFGDPEQCTALRFIEQVEECCEAVRKCHAHLKIKEHFEWQCECVYPFDSDIQKSAEARLRGLKS